MAHSLLAQLLDKCQQEKDGEAMQSRAQAVCTLLDIVMHRSILPLLVATPGTSLQLSVLAQKVHSRALACVRTWAPSLAHCRSPSIHLPNHVHCRRWGCRCRGLCSLWQRASSSSSLCGAFPSRCVVQNPSLGNFAESQANNASAPCIRTRLASRRISVGTWMTAERTLLNEI